MSPTTSINAFQLVTLTHSKTDMSVCPRKTKHALKHVCLKIGIGFVCVTLARCKTKASHAKQRGQGERKQKEFNIDTLAS